METGNTNNNSSLMDARKLQQNTTTIGYKEATISTKQKITQETWNDANRCANYKISPSLSATTLSICESLFVPSCKLHGSNLDGLLKTLITKVFTGQIPSSTSQDDLVSTHRGSLNLVFPETLWNPTDV
jgi:hypothetical protein